MTTPKPDTSSPRYGYGFQLEPQAGIVGHSGGFPGISSNLDVFKDIAGSPCWASITGAWWRTSSSRTASSSVVAPDALVLNRLPAEIERIAG